MNTISFTLANMLYVFETMAGNVLMAMGDLGAHLTGQVTNIATSAMKAGAALPGTIKNLLENIPYPDVQAILAPQLQSYAKLTGAAVGAFLYNTSTALKGSVGGLNSTTPMVLGEISSIVEGILHLIQTKLEEGHPNGHYCHMSYSRIIARTSTMHMQKYATTCVGAYHAALDHITGDLSGTLTIGKQLVTDLLQSVSKTDSNSINGVSKSILYHFFFD